MTDVKTKLLEITFTENTSKTETYGSTQRLNICSNSSYKESWSIHYFLELDQLDFVFLCVIEIVNCKQLKQQCEEKMY